VSFVCSPFFIPCTQKSNLGGNKNEKLLSLPPAVSVKQTASKTL
jgi:hypothetical protein